MTRMHLERGAFFRSSLQQDMESRAKPVMLFFLQKRNDQHREKKGADKMTAGRVLQIRIGREFFDRCIDMVGRIKMVDVIESLNELNIGFCCFLPGDL